MANPMDVRMYANSFPQTGNVVQPAPPVITLSSAISRVDGLNDRLAGLRERFMIIASLVGGPHPAVNVGGTPNVTPNSAVQRLHETAEQAHAVLNDLDDLAASITRSLG